MECGSTLRGRRRGLGSPAPSGVYSEEGGVAGSAEKQPFKTTARMKNGKGKGIYLNRT